MFLWPNYVMVCTLGLCRLDPVVVYAPECVQNGSQSLGLKAVEDFDEFNICVCLHKLVTCCKTVHNDKFKTKEVSELIRQ
jgi:hypothetical protein